MRLSIVLTKGVVIGSVCAGTLVASACTDGRGTPTSPGASTAVTGLALTAPANQGAGGRAVAPALSERSGDLHVTKNCSENTGQPGSFCTITSSNVKAIEVGSRVVYAQAKGAESLNSDVVLELPGNGNNRAYGHCELVFATLSGLCTFEGGTGKFTHFRATAVVSHRGGFDWAWDGPYSLSPQD